MDLVKDFAIRALVSAASIYFLWPLLNFSLKDYPGWDSHPDAQGFDIWQCRTVLAVLWHLRSTSIVSCSVPLTGSWRDLLCWLYVALQWLFTRVEIDGFGCRQARD